MDGAVAASGRPEADWWSRGEEGRTPEAEGRAVGEGPREMAGTGVWGKRLTEGGEGRPPDLESLAAARAFR